MSAASDDGFVAWINGIEFARRNVVPVTPPFNGLAASQVTEPQPTVDYVVTNTAGVLREGVNVVAVQALNALVGSSDFGFMASLTIASDINPPRILSVLPPPDSEVDALTQITIAFDQSVGGLAAEDLRINGAPAATMSVVSPLTYRFTFPTPSTGVVSVAWTENSGITNSAGDVFGGGAWRYVLNPNIPPPSPMISEFLADNRGGLYDEDRDASDWIELFNPMPRAISLDGWYLTDSTNRLTKWRLPNVTLPTNSYLVVFASGKNRTNTTLPLHTNFKLDDEGGYIALIRPDGTNVSSEYRYKRQRKNVSYGLSRIPVLAERYFAPPSPGAPNSAGYANVVADTHFTTNRGIYYSPIDVTVWVPTDGATLVVTTNGSEPSLTNGTRAPGTNITLKLSTTTLLRAAAYRTDWLPTDIDTHSYLFPAAVVTQSAPLGAATAWPDPSGSVNADFEMDMRVVSNPLPGYEVTNSLVALPIVSVVTANDGLFGASNGIYVRSLEEGDSWVRRASFELIYPDGRRGFQHNIGITLRGGASRFPTFTPKHGFTALFRTEYGSGELDFPIFPDSSRRRFNRLILRANSTDTWAVTEWPQQLVNGQLRWNRAEASYMRDEWVRRAQQEMGHASATGVYVQLFLNGLYWGLYNVVERPDDDFGAEYLGGDEEDYDAISDATDLHAGDWNAWNQLRGTTGLESDANYQRLMGNNVDGTRNTNYPVLLDVTNLVDYMILHIFIGADDWPDHNWWAIRDRRPSSSGFKFAAWDQEISINSLIKQHSAWVLLRGGAPWYAEESTANTPAEVYAHCRANAEFRQFFGDRVHKHLFNGGALSVQKNIARWCALSNILDRAVVAESARWGDFQRPSRPFRREVEWLNTNIWECSIYFPSNHSVAMKRFSDASLYPAMSAPTFRQHGGLVTNGWQLVITNTQGRGNIYYTVDGTDPRLRGGGVAPTARVFANPYQITTQTLVKARVRDGTSWSALVEAQFYVPQDYSALRVSEIHYNPPSFEGTDGERFEFLELQNVGPIALDLSGLRFSTGVNHVFTNGAVLAPNAFCVLVNSITNFSRLWPLVPVAGEFGGKLANDGEPLALEHPTGFVVFSFAYNDLAPWPMAADGAGASLQRRALSLDPGNPTSWAAAIPTPGAPFNPDADADSDGLPDVWELAYGTDPLRPDADADPDGDGSTNSEEFIAGTEPRDANSALRIAWIRNSGGGAIELHFTAFANRGYSILWRSAADTGDWQKLADIAPAATNRSVIFPHVEGAETTRFYRLVAPGTP